MCDLSTTIHFNPTSPRGGDLFVPEDLMSDVQRILESASAEEGVTDYVRSRLQWFRLWIFLAETGRFSDSVLKFFEDKVLDDRELVIRVHRSACAHK